MMESRPLDAAYDPTYIGPFSNAGMDTRVRATVRGRMWQVVPHDISTSVGQ